MQLGIEALAMGSAEFLEERRLVAPMPDIVADVIRIREREHDQIVALATNDGAGSRSLGFLVRSFAVDDGRDVLAGILPHAFPDAHDIAAGGIHDLAADFLDARLGGLVSPEGGNDHHVLGVQVTNLGFLVLAQQVLDAQRHDLLVDLGVVNDFPEDEEPPIVEDLGRGVREIDGPLDAVAKAELLRQSHRHTLASQRAPTGPQPLHDLAAVVGLDLRLHRGVQLRRAEIDASGFAVGWIHAGEGGS
jgi:hypothetical protein